MDKRGSIKRDLIIFLFIIIVAIIVLAFKVYNDVYDRYEIGDYGVSIRVPSVFETDKEDEDNLLALCMENNAITIKARDLRGEFWSQDDMDVIIDEYVKVISAMEFDYNIYDVETEKRKVDFKEVGIVRLTTNLLNETTRCVSVLTHKANGYILIEIYGVPEVMESYEKNIENMINSIKFGSNNHDYSKDDSKGVLDVYRDINGNEITFDSGDDLMDKIRKIYIPSASGDVTAKSGENELNY